MKKIFKTIGCAVRIFFKIFFGGFRGGPEGGEGEVAATPHEAACTTLAFASSAWLGQAVDEARVGLKPSTLSFLEAGTLPLVALTSLQTLDHGKVIDDEIGSSDLWIDCSHPSPLMHGLLAQEYLRAHGEELSAVLGLHEERRRPRRRGSGSRK